MKIVKQYEKKKEKNKGKLYVFKSGIFYIFVEDDAKYISEKYNLKLTPFGNSVKCGFPVSALNKYLLLFKEENIEIVDNEEVCYEIINDIKNVDLGKVGYKKAYKILTDIKEKLSGC